MAVEAAEPILHRGRGAAPTRPRPPTKCASSSLLFPRFLPLCPLLPSLPPSFAPSSLASVLHSVFRMPWANSELNALDDAAGKEEQAHTWKGREFPRDFTVQLGLASICAWGNGMLGGLCWPRPSKDPSVSLKTKRDGRSRSKIHMHCINREKERARSSGKVFIM